MINPVFDIEDIDLLAKAYCPNCGRALGYWNMIRGKIALKINNGTIDKIRI